MIHLARTSYDTASVSNWPRRHWDTCDTPSLVELDDTSGLSNWPSRHWNLNDTPGLSNWPNRHWDLNDTPGLSNWPSRHWDTYKTPSLSNWMIHLACRTVSADTGRVVINLEPDELVQQTRDSYDGPSLSNSPNRQWDS